MGQQDRRHTGEPALLELATVGYEPVPLGVVVGDEDCPNIGSTTKLVDIG